MARPRSIPEEEVLEHALKLFWAKGYDRTSIADLSSAIGLGPSSIYNTFGSKEALFQRALERYVATHACFVQEVVATVEERGAETSIRTLLRRAARLYSSRDNPPGCAMLQGGGGGGSEDAEGARIARQFRLALEESLRGIFKKARADESLSASPKLLAKLVLGGMRGLAQLACDGTSRRDLLALADHIGASCFKTRRRHEDGESK